MRPDTQPWADLEERLRLALRAQTKIRNYANNLAYNDQFRGDFETFRINMMHLSLFVHWDIADLRIAVRRELGDVLYRMLNNVEPFLANLVDNLPSSSLQVTPSSDDRKPGPHDVERQNQDTIEIVS